mmetsp:Transcript_11745/g.47415  ORF Transcript_11745/g.47415 Transcript_11745/m.47415 type:complete len:693 (-) Transcript_11745:659-2737(-)
MRQRAAAEAEGDTLALDVLLAHAGNHLTDVDVVALGAGLDHRLDVVGVRQRALGGLACLVAGSVQLLVHLGLEGLDDGASGHRLQAALLQLVDVVVHLALGTVDRRCDLVLRVAVGNSVANADRVAALQQPVVDEALRLVDEETRDLGAHLVEHDVDQAAGRGSQRALVEGAAVEAALLDDHLCVRLGDHIVGLLRVGAVGVVVAARDEVDGVGNNQREQLLASPQRPRLEDGRLGDLAVEVLDPHQHVHDDVLLDERAAVGHQLAAEQRVLHDTDHGLVRLRRDDLRRHHHQLAHLGAALDGLRHVEVHLVTVEIGVVGRRHREVEAEGGEGHNLDPVSHHGHLVQRRLSVEDNDVSVLHVPLHLVAVLQVDVRRLLDVTQVAARALVRDDVLGAGVIRRAVADQLVHAVAVERRHDLGVCEVARDRAGHADLVDADVRVGRDDGASGEVHSLAHEVASHAALLALEALRDRLQSPAALLYNSRHVRDVVVAERVDVRLQEALEVADDVRRRVTRELRLQSQVGADDVTELVCQVILALAGGTSARHDRRAHRRGRDGHDADDHPLGARVLGVQAQQLADVVRDVGELLHHLLGREFHLLLDHLVGVLGELGEDGHAAADDPRQDLLAVGLLVLHVLGLLLEVVERPLLEGRRLGVGACADLLVLAEVCHCLEPLRGVADLASHHETGVLL